MDHKQRSLQAILDTLVDGKFFFGTTYAIKKDETVWFGSAGDMSIDQSYFIASTTKLFTTAIVLQLRSRGQLSLDDKISKYLDDSILNGIHVYKKVDYASDITIRHLLAHTSGLPDYFQNKGPDGKSLEDEIMSGHDRFWTFEQALEISKAMRPLFRPGEAGRAHYSDTNFQLLGRIIENITGKPYVENCEELIFTPLQLQHTYLYQDSADRNPKNIYYKANELDIPKAMTSFGPDGGIVSRSSDILVFIEGFFFFFLFPVEYIEELKQWNRIFFPLQSGVGILRFKLPWIFDPMGVAPEFIGHSGLSGALAFYSPADNLYVVGTVNQVAHPDVSFRTMIKLVQQILKK